MTESNMTRPATAPQRNTQLALPRPGANKGSRHNSAVLLDTLLSSSPLLANSTRHSVTSRIEPNSRPLCYLIFSTRHLNATPEKRDDVEKFNTCVRFFAASASLSKSKIAPRLLELFEGLRDFRDVWHGRNIVIFEPGDFAIAVDDGDGAPGDPFVGEVDAELIGDRAARLEIGEQRIIDAELFGECLVRPHAIDAQAEHLRVELVEALQIVDEADVFIGADRAPIERIEHEHDIFLAAKIRQLHILLILILERKIRSLRSYSQCWHRQPPCSLARKSYSYAAL